MGWTLSGDAGRFDERGHEDDFTQAGDLYRLMPEAEKDRTTSNIARAMASVSDKIIARQLAHFSKADTDYGKRVAEQLKKLNNRMSTATPGTAAPSPDGRVGAIASPIGTSDRKPPG